MWSLYFIENAFKYSRIDENLEDAFISIFVSSKLNILHFNIKNNKPSNSVPSGNGLGMRNVEKRLEILFSGKHQLNVMSEEDAFEVDLKIELSWN